MTEEKKRAQAVLLIQNWYRTHQVASKFREAQTEFREILKRIEGVSDGKQSLAQSCDALCVKTA